MKKRIAIACLGLIVVVGIIAGIKFLQIRRMISHGESFVPPPETVNSAEIQRDSWELAIQSVGTLEAVQGVDITAELSGRVEEIAFDSGEYVEKGDLLVKFDTSTEEALLRAAEAAVDLARISFARAAELVKMKSVAQANYDIAEAQLKEALAQVDNIKSVIAKKTVSAPFAGRLGIRLVNVGQILKEGEPIVTLQALNPIYVNFFLPQQNLAIVEIGTAVKVTTDIMDGTIEGSVTAISPEVESTTRNVLIQATIENRGEKLRPGMFVNVSMVRPEKKDVLVIPATAVLYAPYSDSVFVIEEKNNEQSGQSDKLLRQQFVRLGEKRGDFVSVLSGLHEGETIVSTGVFKLRNGMKVVVDNSVEPEFKLNPKPEDR